MSRLILAVEQITFARDYANRLLADVPDAQWFQMAGGISHIAWQVGHLAMAEYRMALERIRGRRDEDAALISDDFLKLFGGKSVPIADSGRYPPPPEIRAVFERVHRQALGELASLPESELDAPVLKPHPVATTKLASLLWCGQHEMLHAGQIGLLRRQLGHPPRW